MSGTNPGELTEAGRVNMGEDFPAGSEGPSALRRQLEELQAERASLLGQITELRAELVKSESVQNEFADALQYLAQRERELSMRAKLATDENTRLTMLQVACQQLHDAEGVDELVLAIREIVANMIGSEELGIFECSQDARTLHLIGRFGLEDARWQTLDVEGALASCLAKGETVLEGSGAELGSVHGLELTALVPLRFRGDSIGLIAIFGLLPQKVALADSDRELLSLLSHHGGVALHLCGERSPSPAKP